MAFKNYFYGFLWFNNYQNSRLFSLVLKKASIKNVLIQPWPKICKKLQPNTCKP